MPLQATSGAASYDAFGGGVPVVPQYIEDVFSTYLYTNNTYPSNLTITNGIDLSGKGGLVWMKNRSLVRNHNLYDTARGALKQLRSDGTDAQITNASGYGLTAFNANGFSLGTDIDGENYSNVVSWTFRKQPKFFDVVTWTGDGNYGRTVAHSLGSTPGCIIVKRTDTTSDWAVYHRGLTSPAAERWLKLNLTAAQTAFSAPWADTAPSSTVFTVSASATVNASGGTYVAYIFAHDAGGFGLTGTDNVISCGSATVSAASSVTVNLGYEPQFVLIKPTTFSSTWWIADNMRGMSNGASALLRANTSGAEYSDGTPYITPTATGFVIDPNLYGSDATVIYIAIRRGPMKVPTSGTSVFNAIARTGTSANATVTGVGFAPDLAILRDRTVAVSSAYGWEDRLRGATKYLDSRRTDIEETAVGAPPSQRVVTPDVVPSTCTAEL